MNSSVNLRSRSTLGTPSPLANDSSDANFTLSAACHAMYARPATVPSSALRLA